MQTNHERANFYHCNARPPALMGQGESGVWTAPATLWYDRG